MSETSGAVEPTGTPETTGTSEATGADEASTVRYRVATLGLGGDRPTGALPPGIDRVIIEADVVRIEGLVRWPGCEVDLSARVIEVVGSEPAVLDVSGAEPVPNFDGAEHAPAGQAGAPGGSGRDGGAVTIVAGEIVGELEIRSNGGPGGNGQGGGDGIAPAAKPAAKDGRFTAKTKFGLSHWKSSGPYGGKVLVKPGIGRAYVAVAYGANGSQGHNGGLAGTAGQPGDGGAAGLVQVRLGDQADTTPTIDAAGGAAGAPGPAGKPPAGGAGALGGRNRIYWYSWPNTHEGHTNGDDTLRQAARDHRIAHRARTGAHGAPGAAPESPTAEPGPATEPVVEQMVAADLGADLTPELLTYVLGLAERVLASGDRDGAEDRLRWLVDVTAERSDDEGRRVGETAAGHRTTLAEEEPAA